MKRGKGNAFPIIGLAYDTQAKITDFNFRIGEHVTPITDYGSVREDYFGVLGVMKTEWATDALAHSIFGHFRAIVQVPETVAPGRQRMALEISLDDGAQVTVELGSVMVDNWPEPSLLFTPQLGREPSLVVTMATYDPDLLMFERQVQSVLAQTIPDFGLLIQDDASPNVDVEAFLRHHFPNDPRILFRRNAVNLGVLRNFETALASISPATELVAICDQDDDWHPEKLSVSLASLCDPNVIMVHCDARVVTADGEIISPSMHLDSDRLYDDSSLTALIFRNSVTGASSVFRRELLDVALPFPELHITFYYDHWIACCAASLGAVRRIDKPLYDYVQHGSNVIGHIAAKPFPSLGWHCATTLATVIKGSLFRYWSPMAASMAQSVSFHDRWFLQFIAFATVLRLRMPDNQQINRINSLFRCRMSAALHLIRGNFRRRLASTGNLPLLAAFHILTVRLLVRFLPKPTRKRVTAGQ